MKHIRTLTKFTLASALALISLVACQREEEFGQKNNPTYNPADNTVKTDFYLTVSTANGPEETTKTTADWVQAGSSTAKSGTKFLGMEAVHLLTYDIGKGGYQNFYFNPWKNGTEKQAATRDFDLGQLLPENAISENNQSRSVELALPLDTDCVVLYGKAKKTQTSDLQGAVSTKGDVSDLSTLRFSLVPRLSEEKKFKVGAVAFSRMLNFILCAGLIQEERQFDSNEKLIKGFWWSTTGEKDRRYGFWWPLPAEGSDAETDLAAYAAAEKLMDPSKESVYTKAGPSDYQVQVPSIDPVTGNPVLDPETGEPVMVTEHRDYSDYTWHQGQLSWKQLGQMYNYKYDADENGTNPTSITPQGMALSPLGETLGEAYAVLTKIEYRETQKIDPETGKPMYEEDDDEDPDNDKPIMEKTVTELRAGSAQAVLRTMEDLYSIVDKASQARSTGWEEYACQLLADVIKERMGWFFSMESTGFYYKTSSGKGQFSSSDISKLIGDLELLDNPNDGFNSDDMNDFFNKDYFPTSEGKGGFPLNLDLPGGAACLECNVVADQSLIQYPIGNKQMDTFSYTMDIPAYGMGGATFPILNYRYPVELMYYGNSPIRTKNDAENDWPKSATAWDGTHWTNHGWVDGGAPSEVTSTTRSVAMIKHINYGNALLKSRIMYGNGVTVLKDNNHDIHPSETDNDVPLTGLVVTGLVVGGQPDAVCWDYTRAANNNDIKWQWVANTAEPDKIGHFTDNGAEINFGTNQFNKMIYDKVADMAISTYIAEPANPNDDTITAVYTPCWDNYDATKDADQQQDVYVALEIRNDTGEDFWGELNLIRKGGTFYLVGKLDMKSANAKRPAGYKILEGTTNGWDLSRSNYNYPPYHPETGETISVPRIFMQDYMTTANLILGQDCLKHAYVTVPDLRSSQVSLGLFIDMSWSKGLSFDVQMGAGN